MVHPRNRVPVQPGDVLLGEFLTPLGLTPAALVQRSGVPLEALDEIIQGKRGVTFEVARLLSQSLGTTPEFWVNLQVSHDRATLGPDEAVKAADTFVRAHSKALTKLED